jgi:signal peptidase I
MEIESRMADEHITSAPSAPATTPDGAPPAPVDGVAPSTSSSANATATVPPAPAPAPPKAQAPTEPKDVYREVAETVVFVVVLVLLLKTFIAEAFVIPTGSMATTLWGYQKYVECPNCGYSFPVNASREAEAPPNHPNPVTRCDCPNCRYAIDFEREGMNPSYHSGDRVLVFKSLYDTGLRSPHRHDVVVFKYPAEPMDRISWQQMNYIKRLIGLPEETIAIAQGQLYVWRKARAIPPPEGRYYARSKAESEGSGFPWPEKDDEAEDVFRKSLQRRRLPSSQRSGDVGFDIIRKAPDIVLAMRRIVFDNDFQSQQTDRYPVRWTGEPGWQAQGALPRTFKYGEPGSQLSWLHYKHLLTAEAKPELITDFMGYNSDSGSGGDHWVGDLILECTVQIDKVQSGGELRLELARGVDRFQARFNLESGECTLHRLAGDGEKPLALRWPEDENEPAKRPTALKQAGTHRVRLANVGERLTVWVNDDLVFGDGVKYPPADTPGPTANDLAPANIGLQGAAASLSHLSLWRDTYYTQGTRFRDAESLLTDARSDPAKWNDLQKLTPRFFYVQPGHYLCFGDNSPASSDSRTWGMVPERLMLGRALMVYFPFYFPYRPLDAPTNRIGPIR